MHSETWIIAHCLSFSVRHCELRGAMLAVSDGARLCHLITERSDGACAASRHVDICIDVRRLGCAVCFRIITVGVMTCAMQFRRAACILAIVCGAVTAGCVRLFWAAWCWCSPFSEKAGSEPIKFVWGAISETHNQAR